MTVTIFASVNYGQSALDKGNYQLAGSLSYSRTETNNDYFDDKSTRIRLSPQYSYFIMDNLLVGGIFSFNYSEYEWLDPETTLSISRSLGIGPVVKYYFRTEKLIPFIGVSALYRNYLGEDAYGYEMDLSAGFDFFIAKSLALEPFISYNIIQDYEPEADQTTLEFGLRLNYFIIE